MNRILEKPDIWPLNANFGLAERLPDDLYPCCSMEDMAMRYPDSVPSSAGVERWPAHSLELSDFRSV